MHLFTFAENNIIINNNKDKLPILSSVELAVLWGLPSFLLVRLGFLANLVDDTFSWRDNLRELRACVERSVVMSVAYDGFVKAPSGSCFTSLRGPNITIPLDFWGESLSEWWSTPLFGTCATLLSLPWLPSCFFVTSRVGPLVTPVTRSFVVWLSGSLSPCGMPLPLPESCKVSLSVSCFILLSVLCDAPLPDVCVTSLFLWCICMPTAPLDTTLEFSDFPLRPTLDSTGE